MVAFKYAAICAELEPSEGVKEVRISVDALGDAAEVRVD